MTADITCRNCGAHLPLTGDQAVVVCEYCGKHNPVPAGVRAVAPLPPADAAREDAAAMAAVAGAIAEATAGQISAHVSRTGSAIARKLVGCIVGVVVAVAVLGGVLGAIVPAFFERVEPVVEPKVAGPVIGEVVTPSWESADGLATARNVLTSLEAGWRTSVRCEPVHLFKVRHDGTMDMGRGGEGMLSMICRDPGALAGLAPQTTSVKGGTYMVEVKGGLAGGMETDTTLPAPGGASYLEGWPACDLASLRRAAADAGWPADGYADVTWPDVPYALSARGMLDAVASEAGCGDELVAMMAEEGWDEALYGFFLYRVAGYDAGDLPVHFGAADCLPVDVEAIKKRIVDEMKSKTKGCAPASAKKSRKKKAG